MRSWWGWPTMIEAGGGGFATELEQLSYLVYADHPEHVRSAGGPWAGVARVVEQTAAVLEGGQVKLAEVWRSPAGQLFLTKMGEVSQAMREVSVVARHNGQVMDAAAEALDAKQKDFAVLSTAPIPQDAREGYARAIVKSLDESYQRAVADFWPVPITTGPIDPEQPLLPSASAYTVSRQDAAIGGGSASSGGSARSGGSTGTTPQRLPPWVPTQPAAVAGPEDGAQSASTPGGGPRLQGISTGTTSGWGTTPGGGWAAAPGGSGGVPGATSGGGPSAPSTQVPAAAAGPLPFGAGRAGVGPGGVAPRSVGARPSARQQPGLRTPGTLYPGEAAGRPATVTRTGAVHSGGMLGGVPAGASSAAGRSGWQGYRRPAEPFPISEQAAVAPVIGATPAGGAEPELVSTDYADDYGNRITIRRPA
jgi:hypothetical protein